MRKLRSIQTLRAIAAVGVAAYHASGSTLIAGSAGVDLFFVISGFIMATISPGQSPAAFMSDRVRRIYPLYFICAAVDFLIHPTPLTICRTVISVTLLPLRCNPYLDPAWTLVFEILFYILVALTIARPRLLAPVLICGVIVGRFASIGNLGHPLVLEFLAGFMLAKAPRDERVGAALLLFGATWLAASPDMNMHAMRAFVWGVPATMVVYGALSLERRFASIAWDFPVEIGDASYAIYLTHFTLNRFDIPALPKLGAILAVGYLAHRAIERPLIRLLKRRRKRALGSRPSAQAV